MEGYFGSKLYKIRHVKTNIFPRYNLVSDPKAIQVQGEVSCLRCGGAVFHAEALYAKGRPFHQTCSTCVSCNKRLDSLSLNNGPDGEIYCKGCHENHFGSHKGQAGSYNDVKIMKYSYAHNKPIVCPFMK